MVNFPFPSPLSLFDSCPQFYKMTNKIVSFSGGKDSTAMLLRMLELNMPIDEIIFADTGFEFPELYDYIKRIEKHIRRKVKYLKPKKDFWKWANGKVTRGNGKGETRGLPLRAFPCWWTREAKIIPLQEQRQQKDTTFYVGIAYDEKERMSKVDGNGNIKYPLVEWQWTEADCVKYLNSKGLLNPLYVNFNRLGCWMCPKQGVGSLYVMWKLYPELWSKMKEMEAWQYKNRKSKLYNKDLNQIEEAFKLGYKPPKLPKYGCSHGCESVKKAFQEKQCMLE